MLKKEGKYVVIEGHDGTGKSTQVEMMRKKLHDQYGIESIEFHEPAGSPIADEIRNVIKNGNLERDGITNMLLFSAARHDLWENRAKPALKMGRWVVTSRSYLSTVAYQGYGEGLDLDLIRTVTEKAVGDDYMHPNYEFILSLDDEKERLKRIGNRGILSVKDTFESKTQDFQDKVRNGYLSIAENMNIPIISASQTPEEIADEIWLRIFDK